MRYETFTPLHVVEKLEANTDGFWEKDVFVPQNYNYYAVSLAERSAKLRSSKSLSDGEACRLLQLTLIDMVGFTIDVNPTGIGR